VTKKTSGTAWQLFAYPAFSESLSALVRELARLRAREAVNTRLHPKTKLLKRIIELIVKEIPRDPSAAEYALGNTLGPAHRHWRRAKFLSRFRLFFRYNSNAAVIVYAWINDENTLRKAGSGSDPYHVFAAMLRRGRPPDDWDALMKQARPLAPPKLDEE